MGGVTVVPASSLTFLSAFCVFVVASRFCGPYCTPVVTVVTVVTAAVVAVVSLLSVVSIGSAVREGIAT